MSLETVEVTHEEAVVSVTHEETVVEIVSEETVILVEGSGPQGPQGTPGPAGAGVVEIPFAFGDATPKTLATVGAGKTVYGVGLHLYTAFDGTGAMLSVGDALDPGRLMAAGENAPGEAASYVTSPNHRYVGATALILAITPGGGASQGAGVVTLQVQQ